MTFLMMLAGRAGATGTAQRVLAWVIGFALLIALGGALAGAWAAFDWWNDREAAGRALDKRDAKTKRRVIEADRHAGTAKRDRDTANQNVTQAELERIDNAQAAGCDALDGLFGLCP